MTWNELPVNFSWRQKLTYFLEPSNVNEVSRRDLLDALSVATAMLCDEKIKDGEDRVMHIAREDSTESRARMAILYLESLSEEE